MSDIAVKANHLSKRYCICQRGSYSTFRDAIIYAIKSPYHLLKMSGNKNNSSESFYALKDVSFEVPRGEVVGIIGGNGAGKSTLLKILSRITSPTEGSVELKGRVGSLLEVGTGFHSELTGRENIFLSGSIIGMKRREISDRFDEIVRFAEIETFLDVPVKRYSSGMYVRLAFAVAAHLDPEILLVDEVLAVGDAGFQKKCLGKMGDVAGQGRTVLFVSHQMDMIKSLCRTCILLNHGHLNMQGNTDEVINEYLKGFSLLKQNVSFEVENDIDIPLQILNGKITDDTGKIRGKFDVFDSITLELTYAVHNPLFGSIVNIEVCRNGGILFYSFDTDNDKDLLNLRKPGTYCTKVKIPAPLLKPGRYTITIGTGIANSRSINKLENIICFDIELLSRPSAFLSYAEKRSGVIAAHLVWETKTMT